MLGSCSLAVFLWGFSHNALQECQRGSCLTGKPARELCLLFAGLTWLAYPETPSPALQPDNSSTHCVWAACCPWALPQMHDPCWSFFNAHNRRHGPWFPTLQMRTLRLPQGFCLFGLP